MPLAEKSVSCSMGEVKNPRQQFDSREATVRDNAYAFVEAERVLR